VETSCADFYSGFCLDCYTNIIGAFHREKFRCAFWDKTNLILAGVGFLFSCFGILRVIQKYMKEIASLASKNNEQNKEKNN